MDNKWQRRKITGNTRTLQTTDGLSSPDGRFGRAGSDVSRRRFHGARDGTRVTCKTVRDSYSRMIDASTRTTATNIGGGGGGGAVSVVGGRSALRNFDSSAAVDVSNEISDYENKTRLSVDNALSAQWFPITAAGSTDSSRYTSGGSLSPVRYGPVVGFTTRTSKSKSSPSPHPTTIVTKYIISPPTPHHHFSDRTRNRAHAKPPSTGMHEIVNANGVFGMRIVTWKHCETVLNTVV